MWWLVLLYSCGGDDDNPAVGTWQLSSYATTVWSDASENLTLQLDDDGCISEQGTTICFIQTIDFNENGTVNFDFSFDVPHAEDLCMDEDELDFELM